MSDIISTPPKLTPLEKSHVDNDIEGALNKLFIDLFKAKLADITQDISSQGMAQMGTVELLKRAIAANGLVMVGGANQEDISRHLYKAWVAQNHGGRGFHFLRLYLQLVYPNSWTIEWLSQLKTGAYPNNLLETDGTDPLYFQTSRLNIKVDAIAAGGTLPVHINAITSILPARIVPVFSQVSVQEVKLQIAAIANVSQTIHISATTN